MTSVFIPQATGTVTQAQLTAAVATRVAKSQLTTIGSATGVAQLDAFGGLTLGTSPTWTNHLDVRSLGAKGDGVTDDSTVIQTYINAHSSGGYTLYFPPGTYNLNSNLIFQSCSNVVLRGDGPTTTLRKGANNNQVIVNFQNVTRCTISNLGFDGNATGTSGTPAIIVAGSAAGQSFGVTIENCRISNTITNGAGILLDGQTNPCDSTLVQNCEIYSVGGVGVSQNAVIRSRIEGCRIYLTGLEGITVDNHSDYCLITGNTISNTAGGVGGIGLDNSWYCTITGNVIHNCAIGAITFQNNYLTTQITNPNSISNTITGNTISNNAAGIYLRCSGLANCTFCDRTVITGNTLWGNNTNKGIKLDAGTLRTSIHSNSDADAPATFASTLDPSNRLEYSPATNINAYGFGTSTGTSIVTDTTNNIVSYCGTSAKPCLLVLTDGGQATFYAAVDSGTHHPWIGSDSSLFEIRTNASYIASNISTSGIVQMSFNGGAITMPGSLTLSNTTTANYPQINYNTNKQLMFGNSTVNINSTQSEVGFNSAGTTNQLVRITKTGTGSTFVGYNVTGGVLGIDSGNIQFKTGMSYNVADVISGGTTQLTVSSSAITAAQPVTCSAGLTVPTAQTLTLAGNANISGGVNSVAAFGTAQISTGFTCSGAGPNSFSGGPLNCSYDVQVPHLLTTNAFGTACSIAVGAAMGTGGTVGASFVTGAGIRVSNDTSGMIAIQAGTSGATTGVICTITFGTAYTVGANPIIYITPASNNAGAINAFANSGASNTSFTINTGQSNALTNGILYYWQYLVVG